MLKFDKSHSSTKNSAKSKTAKEGGIVFGIIWTAFSSIFVCAGLFIAYSSFKESKWEEKPCQVETFEVTSDPTRDKAFEATIKYSYLVGTQTHYANTLFKQGETFEDYSKVEELLYIHKTKGINKCYVNPADPTEVLLLKNNITDVFFGLGFTLFGSFFVIIGLNILLNARKSKSTSKTRVKSGNQGTLIAYLFCSVFAVTGTILLISFVFKALDANGVSSWEKVPAKVIWSRVKTVKGKDGNTYKPQIFYKYKFEGKNYKSSTYQIFGGSSSGKESKRKIVSEYKKGKKFDCFVDPKKPWRAVIKADTGLRWLWLLFPLPFMAIGYGGIISLLIKRKEKSISRSRGRVSTSSSGNQPELDLTTKEFSSGKGRFYWILGSIAMALFWNGIVSVFVKDLYGSWTSGNVDWPSTLFMVPFILVGLGFILHIFYRILALFSANARLSITPGVIEFDTNVKVNWEITKGDDKLQSLRIYLIGEEYSTTRNHKKSKMSGYVFYEEELCNITDRHSLKKGSTTVNLNPQQQNMMHTFKAEGFNIGGNGVKWWIWIEGKVAFLPDLSDLHEVEVIAKRRI